MKQKLVSTLLFFIAAGFGFSAVVYMLEGSNDLWFSRMVASAVILGLAEIADGVRGGSS